MQNTIELIRFNTTPANYGTRNGIITFEVKGKSAEEEFFISIDGGYIYSCIDAHPISNETLGLTFRTFGGHVNAILKRKEGAISEPISIVVEKILGETQSKFLERLFDVFGNESQACNSIPIEFDLKGNPTKFLKKSTVAQWKRDPDFIEHYTEATLSARSHYKDYLESLKLRHIAGGFPIYQYVPRPKGEGEDKDVTDRIKIQVGETLPSEKMLQFELERKFKDEYAVRTELTGKNGAELGIVNVMLDEDFSPTFENEFENE